MKIVFFGTPRFAAEVLDYLLQNKMKVAAVVSKPDRPKGRSGTPQPTPVKKIAQKYTLPIHQPELASSTEFADTLQNYNADLFVVVAYGEIVKQHLLDMPKLGCINLHASLLPAYRGAAPIHHCLINGETETGVTIMHMVKKMDAGDIIETQKVPIGENTTLAELEQMLCEAGKPLLLKVIQDFAQGNIKETAQDHSKATFASRIELEDCEVKWDNPAEKLHNLIRGTSPIPGAWCWVNIKNERKRLKLYTSRIAHEFNGKPGEVLSYGDTLIIGCNPGALEILELQLEGKKRMRAEELMRGIPQDFFSLV